MKKYVLIVEDQVIVRKGLKMIVESDEHFSVVAEAGNGIEAIKALETHIVDLVLLDIRMPEMNGVESTRIIMERFPEIRILMLTTFDDDEYVIEALHYGAVGYLLKDVPPAELFAAIRAVYEGGVLIAPKVANKIIREINFADSRKTTCS